MKLEKVKNYNQKILAILGTIAIIFAVVGLIAFITISISEYRRYNYDDTETGILSNEKIEKLQKENKREQVISYQNPKLIDTINSVYIIPVSHKTLNEAEDIGLNGMLNMYEPSISKTKTDSRYSKQFYGAFNNIIIYNQKKNISKKLFKKRVNFSDIKVEYFEDDIFLLFKVSESDTFKDGVINLLDYKSLYIYSLKEKELKKVGNDKTNVYNYQFLNDSKDLIIRFGVDKNDDGKYEEHNEPTIIKKYNHQTGKLTDIISGKINTELQKTLEGSKK